MGSRRISAFCGILLTGNGSGREDLEDGRLLRNLRDMLASGSWWLQQTVESDVPVCRCDVAG